MFDGRLPPGFGVPTPKDDSALAEDEDPLEGGDADLFEEFGSDAVGSGDASEAA